MTLFNIRKWPWVVTLSDLFYYWRPSSIHFQYSHEYINVQWYQTQTCQKVLFKSQFVHQKTLSNNVKWPLPTYFTTGNTSAPIFHSPR